MTRAKRLAAAAAVLAAAAPAVALAATSHGITPSSPRPGAVVPKGKAVTFTGRVRGSGPVYVHVCRSAKRSAKEGVICAKDAIGKATVRNGRFSFRQKAYRYDEYWLTRGGTYSWQAHRIACEGGTTTDCRQEGPVVTFGVK